MEKSMTYDWQKVKLIAMTKPEDGSTTEDLISYCARVSNPKNQENYTTSSKLLKYLMNNQHWSPFEMVSITMEINTTRDIARQILRHRSFSFQEFSQRYADPTKDLGFVGREARLQDLKNRQNSIEIDDIGVSKQWLEVQDKLLIEAKRSYDWAISNGIAKEQARAVLPEGLMMSRIYMAGTLRSWIHYCELRCENGTQKEHREVANSAKQELMEHFSFLKFIWSDE